MTPSVLTLRNLDIKAVCYFQGRNGNGEVLPYHAGFRPFYAFTFRLPGMSAADFCEVRSWCNAALGEAEDGRWHEDFEFWHLGDPAAAEAFEATFVAPRLKPVWAPPKIV